MNAFLVFIFIEFSKLKHYMLYFYVYHNIIVNIGYTWHKIKLIWQEDF